MADVAITGGSGLLGSHLIGALIERGDTVRALVRSEAAATTVSDLGARAVTVDLFDHDAARDAVWGADVVYHLAGVNEMCPKDPGAMDRINIDAVRVVIAACADAGVGRVVVTSSAAAIGEAHGITGTETIVNDGEYVSRYARSKHLGEIAAFEQGAEAGIDVVAVNPSSVQGPGRSGGSARILRYALTAKRPILYDSVLSFVDIRDCSLGHIAAAERGRAGSRYLLSGASLSVSEAIDLAQEISGRTIRPRWVSEGTMRTLGTAGAGVASLFRGDICPDLIRTLLHGHRFDGSLAERDLGLVYTPIETTFADTIAWFEEAGLIEPE